MPTSLVLNGKNVTLDVDPNIPLLWAIQESVGLHDTKFGCGMARCGAYTVQLDSTAVRSCVLPVSAAVGEHVTTVEGVQGKPGKAVQDTWIRPQVPQCGYYQSGQIMSAITLLEQNASPSGADIDAAISGSICRCAAYARIRIAIHETADILEA